MTVLTMFQIAEAGARELDELSPFALLFMLASMGAVTLLAAWCFFKILRGKRHFDPDGTGPAHSPVPGEADSATHR